MKRLLPIALGILCLAVVSVQADEKKKPAGRRPALTEEQKAVRKEILGKYDTNKDGKLSPDERKNISAEDKQKLKKAGLPAGGGEKKKKAK